MEVDNESDHNGNKVPSNDSDDDSDTDLGECDSVVEEAEGDEDLWTRKRTNLSITRNCHYHMSKPGIII